MKKGILYMMLGTMFLVTGCSKEDEPESEPEYKLEGKYANGTDRVDIILEFTGNQAIVVEMGKNKLGTNPSLFSVGQPYIKDIVSTGFNKWSGNLIKSRYRFDMTIYDYILDSISYRPVEITKTSRQDLNMSEYDGMEAFWRVYEGSGNGGGGNSGGGGACIEGTWYSSACGDSKGVVWKFGSNGKGSFSNKDCNGICNPIVFSFSYSISGKTCSISYDAKQPVVKCNGYPDTAPPKPKDESFTFTCDANKLTVTSGSGTNIFTK